LYEHRICVDFHARKKCLDGGSENAWPGGNLDEWF
jgi:hypothetical protein